MQHVCSSIYVLRSINFNPHMFLVLGTMYVLIIDGQKLILWSVLAVENNNFENEKHDRRTTYVLSQISWRI